MDEKLEKVCNDFSKLSEEQKDYILGILQALVFAKSVNVKEGTTRVNSRKSSSIEAQSVSKNSELNN